MRNFILLLACLVLSGCLSTIYNERVLNNGKIEVAKGTALLSENDNIQTFVEKIYVPNNAAKNYIGNAATSANIRLSTNTDIVMAQVITSAIDIYQPDLRATLSINDLKSFLLISVPFRVSSIPLLLRLPLLTSNEVKPEEGPSG